MENYLLIGNGLNRCINSSISWGSLLEDIANYYGVSYNPDITMPLEFERIVNEYLKAYSGAEPNKVMVEIKGKVADLVKAATLPLDAVHNGIKGLNIDGILTTNYDTLLEQVFKPGYSYTGDKKNKKYLFEKTDSINNKAFYHVHGVAGCNTSLCLGYEHYMGVVQNLRQTLNAKKDKKANEMIIKRILVGNEVKTKQWGELFYTSNIGIIGLGLYECESDLWWLITHRAYIYHSDYCGIRSNGHLKNTITFYDVLDELKKDNREDENRRMQSESYKENLHNLLENEHVHVRTFSIGKDCLTYAEAYKLIFDDIQTNGLAGVQCYE